MEVREPWSMKYSGFSVLNVEEHGASFTVRPDIDGPFNGRSLYSVSPSGDPKIYLGGFGVILPEMYFEWQKLSDGAAPHLFLSYLLFASPRMSATSSGTTFRNVWLPNGHRAEIDFWGLIRLYADEQDTPDIIIKPVLDAQGDIRWSFADASKTDLSIDQARSIIGAQSKFFDDTYLQGFWSLPKAMWEDVIWVRGRANDALARRRKFDPDVFAVPTRLSSEGPQLLVGNSSIWNVEIRLADWLVPKDLEYVPGDFFKAKVGYQPLPEVSFDDAVADSSPPPSKLPKAQGIRSYLAWYSSELDQGRKPTIAESHQWRKANGVSYRAVLDARAQIDEANKNPPGPPRT